MVFLNMRTDPFFLYKFFMQICGIWPLDAFKSRSLIVSSVITLLEIVLLLLALISFFAKCSGLGTKPLLIPLIGMIVLSMLRFSMRLFISQLIPVIESTVDDWFSITDPTEWRIMRRHDKLGTYPFVILCIWFFMYTFFRDVVRLAFLNTLTTLDNDENCAGNETLTWGLVLGFLIIAMRSFDILSYESSFLLFWSLTMHLCGQYQILKQQFKEFLLIANKKERRREFRRLVMRHNHLLDLSGKLEDAFNVFAGLCLFSGQIWICIHAIRLGHHMKDSDFVGMSIEFLFIIVYTVCIYAYYFMSDYLTTCGEMIGDVFTQCNWYDLSKESITNYSIVIARSRRSPKLTAAHVYKLNHSNFKYVLNGIYSYVSLILALSKDGKKDVVSF